MSDRLGYIVPIGGAEEKLRGPAILEQFTRICGGSSARIGIIPTASADPETGPRYVKVFEEIGVRETHVLDLESRAQCQDEKRIQILEDLDGVFLTGGNQLRLSTTLGGTAFSSALIRLNAGGLHVAGTSAGAAFLSEHMIAFGNEGPTPRSTMVTLAPGLGLTNRVIIDQHFRQRDRLGRLISAISYNPFTIGIGLDEDTAAFISPDNILEVHGSGGLTIIDPRYVEFSSMDSAARKDPVSVIGLRVHILVEGGTYDLVKKRARAAEAAAGKSQP